MKTDWSNYSITYDGITYDLQYRDKVNLIACEDYTPNSPSPEYPSPITSVGGIDFVSAGNLGQSYTAHRDIILRSLPDGTKDTYDAVTGQITRRVGFKEFDGTETEWNYFSLSKSIYIKIDDSGTVDVPVICTHFKYTQTESATKGYCFWGGAYSASNKNLQLVSSFENLTEGKAWLAAQHAAGTPVAVQYKLAEPITEHINPAPLPTYPRYTHVEQIQDGLKGTIEATVRVVEK